MPKYYHVNPGEGFAISTGSLYTVASTLQARRLEEVNLSEIILRGFIFFQNISRCEKSKVNLIEPSPPLSPLLIDISEGSLYQRGGELWGVLRQQRDLSHSNQREIWSRTIFGSLQGLFQAGGAPDKFATGGRYPEGERYKITHRLRPP